MSIYRGQFKTTWDESETTNYVIDFHVGNTTNVVDIFLGGNPCVIEQKSDGLFSPVKSRSASIEIVSNDYIFDLYTPQSRGIRVMIRKQYPSSSTVIFRGYVVPNVYDQTYTYLDNITINCVDAISTLKDFRYQIDGAPQYRKMVDIIKELVLDCGYEGTLYIPEIYDKLNGHDIYTTVEGRQIPTAIEELYVSEGNFIDDDEKKTRWKKYDILEEILRYLGLTLTIDGENVWLVNYRKNYTTNPTINYMKIDLLNPDNPPTYEPIDKTFEVEYAGGTSNISLDGVYNKIEVNDNLYEIDEIAPDIYKEDIHISVNEEKNMVAGGSRWVKTTVKKHFLRPDTTTEDVIGYQYQRFCRFNPEKCSWTHYYYRHNLWNRPDNEARCDSYYDELSPKSHFTENVIHKYINTHCALIQHYAYRKNNGSNNLPTSLDWEEYLTFFVTDDRTGSFLLSETSKFEKKVLEYNIDEEICWKPSSGISWITLKGDLYYQYNGAKYGEKDKETLNIITDRMYQTAPVEKCVEISDEKYYFLGRGYNQNPQTYDTGFRTWQMGLHIGGKSWNGSVWVDDPDENVTFYINYNNNPDNREDEFFDAFAWMSPVPNVDYTSKVGENAYCIPIKADDIDDVNSPTFGKLKLEIFTPSICSPDFLVSGVAEWNQLANVIYCKGFEMDYVYTSTQTWYSQRKSEQTKNDLVYTNIINTTYTNEFDSVEMKINTQHVDRPISRSYATTENGYVESLHHVCDSDSDHSTGCEQEKNIIDLWYYHFSESQIRYQCNARYKNYFNLKNLHPAARYTFKSTDPINNDLAHPESGFVLDSYSLDLKRQNARLDLVIY